MGRPRRQSGDRSQSPYRLKSDPADVKLENVGFLRIRRWYAMQTSRLRRSDAIQSRPIPSWCLIVLFLISFLALGGRRSVIHSVSLCFIMCLSNAPTMPFVSLFLTGSFFCLENHDGAPAATATSPLSKRKVFGGWVLSFFFFFFF